MLLPLRISRIEETGIGGHGFFLRHAFSLLPCIPLSPGLNLDRPWLGSCYVTGRGLWCVGRGSEVGGGSKREAAPQAPEAARVANINSNKRTYLFVKLVKVELGFVGRICLRWTVLNDEHLQQTKWSGWLDNRGIRARKRR